MSTFWKDKNVLVTGGTGFIGSHVVEKLVEQGARVSVLDNLQNGNVKNIAYLKDSVRFIKGNCADPNDALKACRDQEVVMNLAARVGGIEYNRMHQA
ncbi:MAG: Nucleoside-diphosphate-sugar epimerase, partial [Microgenomates group bacterium GW2011_GWA2_47_8]